VACINRKSLILSETKDWNLCAEQYCRKEEYMSWENKVRKVVPYVAGEQPQNQNVIKLNTNECPYPPAPGVEEVLHHFDGNVLRKYPDPDVTLLRNALAKRYQVAPEQVFVGVGSDDVLAMAFLTFFHSDKPVLFPDITYSIIDSHGYHHCATADTGDDIGKANYHTF
jgi:histidinol-phosphate/aromatic aminotransferase/cobyric acid decarboxylase-like protein